MKMRMRVLALLLSATMIFSAAPVTAYASESGADTEIVLDSADSVDEPIVEDDNDDDSDDAADDIDTPATEPAAGTEDPAEDVLDDSELLEEEIVELEAEVDEAAAVFSVSGDGSLQLKSGASLPSGDTLDIATLTEGTVTKIPEEFFKNCTYKTVIIPATVTTFGNRVFANSTSLETVEFADGFAGTVLSDGMFTGCTRLIDSGAGNGFDVPATIVKIGDSCFNNCTRLNIVTFSDSSALTTISNSAFANCGNLERLIKLNKTGVTSIGELAFQGTAVSGSDLKFPSTGLTIGASAFKDDKELGKLDLSGLSSVTLAEQCFAGSGLRGIKLPSSYSTISKNIFQNCELLEEVTIGSDAAGVGVTTIEGKAFDSCDSLEKVILKNSVTTVANDAFSGCHSLKTVEIYQGKDLDGGSTISLSYDSFPIHEGLTLYGYSGEVEEWVGKHSADGVLYKSLYTGLKIKVNDQYYGSSVSASSSDKTVELGSKVTVKTTPGKGYSLISLSHGNEQELCDSTSSFVIKGSDISSDEKTKEDVVNIRAAFANRNTAFRIDNEKDGETKPLLKVEEDRIFKLSTSGEMSKIRIKAVDSNYGTNYSNPWLWNFKSENTSFVDVDAEGNIRPIKSTEGTTDKYIPVTATLKADSSVKLTVRVTIANTLTYDKITDLKFESNAKMPVLEPLSSGNSLNKHVVTVSKSWLEAATKNKQTRDLKVAVVAIANEKGAGNTDLAIESAYEWTTGNTKIVNVDKKQTSDGKNTIKVCGVGETTITATSKVKPTEKISFVVRVVDKTPYVSDSAIVINTDTSAASPWTKFTLVKSHGGTYDTTKNPVIYAYEKNKWVSKEQDFTAGYDTADGEKQSVVLSLSTASTTYYKATSATNLYARVLIDGEYFYVKLPKVTVVTAAPKPAVKLEGKVNTFYKGGVTDVESKVSVKGTISAIAGYEIDANPTLAALDNGNANDNLFLDNFEIVTPDSSDRSKFVIRQKVTTLKKSTKDNKPVLSGYVCIPYVGGTTAKIKVTVGTECKAPTYVLNKTTVYTHAKAQSQKFELQLLDKSTKAVVDITDSMALPANIRNYDPKSSAKFLNMKPAIDADADTITVTMPDSLDANSTANIVIHDSKCWQDEQSLVYSLGVRVDKKAPAPKMTTTIVVNPKAGDSNATAIKLSDDFYSKLVAKVYENPEDKAIVCTDRAKALDEASKLTVTYDPDLIGPGGVITATIADTDNKPKDGTYNFKFNYTAEYANGAGASGNTVDGTISFRVQVSSKDANLKLKQTTFTLNDRLYGVKDAADSTKPAEIATSLMTPENLPSNITYTADLRGATLKDVTNAKAPIPYTFDESGVVQSSSPIAVSIVDGKMSISLQKKLGKQHKFELTGAKIGSIAIGKITFTVNSIDKEPIISFTAKGTINPLDVNSAVNYTVKVENFAGVIDSSKLCIMSEDVSAGGSFEAVKNVMDSTPEKVCHFKIVPGTGNAFKLMVNNRDSKFVARKYKMQLSYVFGKDTSEHYVYYGLDNTKSIIETTPKQTMPAIKQSATEVTLYSTNSNYGQSVKIEQKVANAGITIDNVKLDKSNADYLKEAFGNPVFDPVTGKVTIKIIDSSLLTKDKDYTLTYNIHCVNQLADTTGTTFKVKVKVK